MKHWVWTAVALGGLLGWGAPPAAADIVFTHRLSYFNITFSQADFSDASAFYRVLLDTTSNDTLNGFTPNLKSSHTNFSWVGQGGMSVNHVVETATSATADLSNNGTFGQSDFSYDTPVQNSFSGVGFGNSWLARGPIAGFHGLRFGGPLGSKGGGAGLFAGGRFDVDIFMSGDWSNLGTGPGEAQLIHINPGWTIDKLFVFNGVQTEFAAHVDDYAGNTNRGPHGNPQIDFLLHGTVQAVPEPATVCLGLLGLALFGVPAIVRRFSAVR